MTETARYAKIVEWSEEDQCYVGSAPGLVYAGCHGSDERVVFDELCDIIDRTDRRGQAPRRGPQTTRRRSS